VAVALFEISTKPNDKQYETIMMQDGWRKGPGTIAIEAVLWKKYTGEAYVMLLCDPKTDTKDQRKLKDKFDCSCSECKIYFEGKRRVTVCIGGMQCTEA